MNQPKYVARAGALAVLAAGLVLGAGLILGPGLARAADPVVGAPERVDVAGVALALETEIWSEAEVEAALASGQAIPATVVLRVTAEGDAVPEGLRIDGVWYVNNGAASEVKMPVESLESPDGEVIGQALQVVDSDGDGWVDVVVGVVDAAGKRYLIRAPSQELRTLL
jgi:hypothetical protein